MMSVTWVWVTASKERKHRKEGKRVGEDLGKKGEVY